MKKNTTISIDFEVWTLARERHNNLSELIEQLLRAHLEEEPEEPRTIEALRQTLKRKEAVTIAMRAELKKLEEKEAKENEVVRVIE